MFERRPDTTPQLKKMQEAKPLPRGRLSGHTQLKHRQNPDKLVASKLTRRR